MLLPLWFLPTNTQAQRSAHAGEGIVSRTGVSRVASLLQRLVRQDSRGQVAAPLTKRRGRHGWPPFACDADADGGRADSAIDAHRWGRTRDARNAVPRRVARAVRLSLPMLLA